MHRRSRESAGETPRSRRHRRSEAFQADSCLGDGSRDTDRRLADIEERQAATDRELRRGLRLLEDQSHRVANNHDRTERAAKDRELIAERQQTDAARSQLLEVRERHAREIRRMEQALEPNAMTQAPSLDMSALREVVEEIQSETLHREDLRRLLEETIGWEFASVARASDVDSILETLEHELHQLPGASKAEVRHMLQRWFDEALRRVLGIAPQQQHEPNEPRQPLRRPVQHDQLLPRNGTSLESQELPLDFEDDSSTRHRRQRALTPPVTAVGERSAPEYDAIGRIKHSKSSTERRLARAMVRETRNGPDTALARFAHTDLPDDSPDNASQVMAWERSRASRSHESRR